MLKDAIALWERAWAYREFRFGVIAGAPVLWFALAWGDPWALAAAVVVIAAVVGGVRIKYRGQPSRTAPDEFDDLF